MVTLLLVFLQFPFLLQEKHTITKGFKGPYESALIEYKKAHQALDEGDSFEAIEFLDRIISNKNVKSKYREVNLRIEKAIGTYGPYVKFFPYQLRGRARLARAQRTVAHDQARKHLQLAKKDFEESIRRGLKSSEDFLAQTVQKLEERKEPPVTKPPPPVTKDREPKFRSEWEKLVEDHRYSSAQSHIDSDGGFLSDKKRKSYKKDTDRQCREFLQTKTLNFLGALEKENRDSILAMRSTLFQEAFSLALPAIEVLSTTTATYKWCQRVVPVLESMRRNKRVVEDLIDLAITALPLVPKGENGWYRWAEDFAYSKLKASLIQESNFARDANKPDRKLAKERCLKLEKVWKTFENKVKDSPSFHSRKIDTLISFPEDYPGIETLQEDVEKALAEADFIKALQDFEEKHQRPKGYLTIESRREILRCRIAAKALLLLHDIKSEEQAAKSLMPLGKSLMGLCPKESIQKKSFQFERFGPRVEKVFELMEELLY